MAKTIKTATAGNSSDDALTHAPDADAEAQNTADTLRVANEDTASAFPEERTVEEVRQGHTGDHLRYILALSVAGIVLVFVIVYFAFIG